MYVIYDKNGMIMVYRDLELMLSACETGDRHRMYSADYVFSVDRGSDCCKVIKDRSGIFSKENSHSVKKILEIVDFLYKTEKSSTK